MTTAAIAADKKFTIGLSNATQQPGTATPVMRLRGRPVTMRTVDLPVDVPSVDEKDGVFARCRGLPFVQDPQRAWQRDRVEHVRSHGDHQIDASVLD